MKDANGVQVALVAFWDYVQRQRFSHRYLSSDEALKIAKGIARLPELMAHRRDSEPRGSGFRLRKPHPYHVAVEESYHRAHWFEIDALCKHNNIPVKVTGEKIKGNGLEIVFEFMSQMDAVMFWDRLEGRLMKGEGFYYPDRPANRPQIKTERLGENEASGLTPTHLEQ